MSERLLALCVVLLPSARQVMAAAVVVLIPMVFIIMRVLQPKLTVDKGSA